MGRHKGGCYVLYTRPAALTPSFQLEEIAPAEESSGAVVVLDGAGGIPPDGEQTGTFNWAEYLRTAAVSPVGKRIAVEALFGATNYIQAGRQLLVDPLEYDFDAFDLEGARRAVKEAVDSKASLPYASKRFVAPVGGGGIEALLSDESVMTRLGIDPRKLKRGLGIAQTPVPGSTSGMFMEEGVNMHRKDNPGNTACANCGSPNDLKACGNCGQRYYCTKECQKASLRAYLWIHRYRD